MGTFPRWDGECAQDGEMTPMARTIRDRRSTGLPGHTVEEQAQDQRRNDSDLVALKDVGGHAGAVADVVAHQVGHYGCIARVILGQALFDLADESAPTSAALV